MKKIILILTIISILALSILPVGASNEVSDIKLEYSINENGNVVVSASIVDIKESTGLSGIIYYIKVDTSALQYVKETMNMPTKWEPLVESDFAECTFYEESKGTYVWFGFIINSGEGYGIKEDDQLRIDIEFKPLTNNSTTVSFECDSIFNDTEDALMSPLKGGNASINIDLASVEIPSVEESKEEQTREEISIESQTTVEVTEEVSSEVPTESSIEESIENTDQENSNQESSTETENTSVELSSDVTTSNNDSDSSESNEQNSSKTEDNNNSENDNTLIWVIAGILVVVAIAVVAVIIIRKKQTK